MTIIDGIGDEVTYFFIAAVVIIIATIAWITTDIQQGLYVRTVYLIEHSRNQTRLTTLTNHTESATISEGLPSDGETEVQEVSNNEGDESSGEEVIELLEDGAVEIIEAMDAPEHANETVSLLRQRRLQHFNIANEATATSYTPSEVPEQSTTERRHSESDPASNITIKLKYINDELKIVDGRLEELLGDFKRRHFNVELQSNKLVRLIFNGQVLQGDTQTLESYGMFDNCVVHCLVHQPRTTAHGDGSTRTEASNNRGSGSTATHRDWDLGNLLIATLSFTLGSAWYFRYQYPQLFTISTTVGLIALTGMFSVISMSMYFPDFVTRVQVTSANHPTSTNTTNLT